jgi:hypothetical protein
MTRKVSRKNDCIDGGICALQICEPNSIEFNSKRNDGSDAIIGNMNIPKAWSGVEVLTDFIVSIFGFQHKFWPRGILRKVQRVYSLPFSPFHSRNSNSTEVKPRKMFPSVSRTEVRVFWCLSRWL